METRPHCQFASSFQPLCWGSGIKAFCTEAQNAGSGRKLTDDPIQLLPTLHSHWNPLGSLLEIGIPVHPLWGRTGGWEWISRSAHEPGNLYFYQAPWGPSWGQESPSSNVKLPSECHRPPRAGRKLMSRIKGDLAQAAHPRDSHRHHTAASQQPRGQGRRHLPAVSGRETGAFCALHEPSPVVCQGCRTTDWEA